MAELHLSEFRAETARYEMGEAHRNNQQLARLVRTNQQISIRCNDEHEANRLAIRDLREELVIQQEIALADRTRARAELAFAMAAQQTRSASNEHEIFAVCEEGHRNMEVALARE